MKKTSKTKKFTIIIGIVVCIMAGTVLIYACMRFFPEKRLEYHIKTEANGVVRIKVTLKQPLLSKLDNAEFHLCADEMSGITCVDENGSRVGYTIDSGMVKLGSIGSYRLVDFSYEIYRPPIMNVTAFSGEDALIIPADWTVFQSIAFKGESFDGANSVLPCKKIEKPAWIDMHNLSKSCIVFGDFREYKLDGGLSLYMDRSLDENGDRAVIDSVNAVNSFFREVFEGNPKFSLVVANRSESGEAFEIVGGQSMILPFDISDAYDCKAICHSLFYAFFDSFVDSRELRFAPNLWLNRGLSTYYENLAFDAMPESVRDEHNLDSNRGLSELYTRFLYFRIKEPFAYNATPGEEELLGGAAGQFYYFTKSPLIVADIENLSGNNHVLIRNLVGNNGNSDYTVSRLMYDSIGAAASSDVLDYLNNKKLIPAPVIRQEEDVLETLRAVMEYEFDLDSWYILTSPDYPVEIVYPLNPISVLEMTNELDIMFSDYATESLVREYSPALFVLLRQNALRAYVCGASVNDPALRFILAQDEYVRVWESFIAERDLENIDDTD